MNLKHALLILFLSITSSTYANNRLDYIYRMMGNPTKGMKTLTIQRNKGDKEIYYLNKDAKIDSFVVNREKMSIQYGEDALTIKMYREGELTTIMEQVNDSMLMYGFVDGKKEIGIKEKLDAHRNIVKQDLYQNNVCKKTIKFKRTYDEKGHCIKEEKYEGDSKVQVLEKKYNSKGVLVEIRTLDGKGQLKYHSKYDNSGLLIEMKEDGKVYEVKHKFDAKGNWIERITTEKNNPTAEPSVTKREIEYY